MPASRAPALGEPSRGLSRRQPGDGSRWDGALAARRRGGGEASLAGCARQRERPAGILPATAAASCDSRPSRCGDFLLARLFLLSAGTRLVWVNEKSSAQFVYVRLSEWLGWPQASPREPLRCHISSLVIVETLTDSFEETQTRQTVLSYYGHQ